MRTPLFIFTFLAISLSAIPSARAQVDLVLFPDVPVVAEIKISDDFRIKIRGLVEQSRHKDVKLKDQALTELENLGREAVPVLKQLAQAEATLFDPNEGLVDNIDAEVWEGYYYYSTTSFEKALHAGVEHIRFRFIIKRNADGTFSGTGSERARNLGKSEVKGSVNRHKGSMLFEKQYVEKAAHSWVYQGKWNEHTKRIEGYYGDRQGGFVLYPRPLTKAERKAFD